MEISAHVESWPIAGRFTIARGSKTVAEVIVAQIKRNGITGRGESVPYSRYHETPDGVADTIRSVSADGLTNESLQSRLPPGAARNAVDCALWDLAAKSSAKRIWTLMGVPAPRPLLSAYTISLDEPATMRKAAAAHAKHGLLKIKLGGERDLERVAAVRKGAPRSRLIVDANEGWSIDDYLRFAPELKALGVTMIEQPLPAAEDTALDGLPRPVPLCADESCHDRSSLPGLGRRYDMINIKLDKAGGLTEALALRDAAHKAGLGIMVGCMVGTSLAMAPGIVLAQDAAVVDLDGPLLLERDREHGIEYENGWMQSPDARLWG